MHRWWSRWLWRWTRDERWWTGGWWLRWSWWRNYVQNCFHANRWTDHKMLLRHHNWTSYVRIKMISKSLAPCNQIERLRYHSTKSKEMHGEFSENVDFITIQTYWFKWMKIRILCYLNSVMIKISGLRTSLNGEKNEHNNKNIWIMNLIKFYELNFGLFSVNWEWFHKFFIWFLWMFNF